MWASFVVRPFAPRVNALVRRNALCYPFPHGSIIFRPSPLTRQTCLGKDQTVPTCSRVSRQSCGRTRDQSQATLSVAVRCSRTARIRWRLAKVTGETIGHLTVGLVVDASKPRSLQRYHCLCTKCGTHIIRPRVSLYDARLNQREAACKQCAKEIRKKTRRFG